MAKTPVLDTEQVFETNKTKSMSGSELASLSEEQKKKLKADMTARQLFE